MDISRLLEKCQEWHEEEEYRRIVDELETLPENERTAEIDCELARAYNNLGNSEDIEGRKLLRKALRLLEKHEEELSDDYSWNFRIGYSLIFLEREGEALPHFEKALELHPGDDPKYNTREEIQTFIDSCRENMALPTFEMTFSTRVALAWEEFEKEEAEIRRMMDSDRRDDYSEELIQRIQDVLEIALDDPTFEFGVDEGKHDLVLVTQGDKTRLFEYVYFRDHAPESVLENWKITVGRPPRPEFHLRVFDLDVCGDDVDVWVERTEEDHVSLKVHSDKVQGSMEDEDKVWWMLFTVVDNFIGEVANMRHVESFEVVYDLPEGQPIRLNDLPKAIEDLGIVLTNDAESYLQRYTVYKTEPDRESDGPWRLDIISGSNSCPPIVNDYYSGERRYVNTLHADGAVAGYIAYSLDTFDGEDRSDRIFDFRDSLEEALADKAGEDSFKMIGGATGLYYGYLDLIAWDLPSVLSAAQEFLTDSGVSEAFFRVFAMDVPTCLIANNKDGDADLDLDDIDYIPYDPKDPEPFYDQITKWNEEDEYSRCIAVLETIPEELRDYRSEYALVRALQNYAIIGDHDEGTPDYKGDRALRCSLEILESLREEGKDRAEWNMRMAYGYQYLEGQEEMAIPYAERWSELDPDDPDALGVISECKEAKLLSLCQSWHESEEYQKIVDALESLPEDRRTAETDSELARAYNNLAEPEDSEMFQKALDLLDSRENELQDDPLWNFRRGYSLFYLDREGEALDCFNRVLEIEPDDSDAEEMASYCRDALTVPSMKPFRRRADDAWEAFEATEGELRLMIDSKNQITDLEKPMKLCKDILEIAFHDVSFELGRGCEKYEITLVPDSKADVFQMAYFAGRIPDSLRGLWEVVVGRRRSVAPRLHVGDLDVTADDIMVSVKVLEEQSVGLMLHCDKLNHMLTEEKNKLSWMMSIMLDQTLGQIAVMWLVDDFDVSAELLEDAVPLSDLPSLLESMGMTLFDDAIEFLDHSYTSYQMNPSDVGDVPRSDVIVGSCRLQRMLNEYLGGEDETADALRRDGAVAGFIYYPQGCFDGDHTRILNFRDELEEAISRDAGDCVTFIGGASGSICGYLDFIAWDIRPVLEAARNYIVGAEEGPEWSAYQSFRHGAGSVSIHGEDGDGDSLLGPMEIATLKSFIGENNGQFGRALAYLLDFIDRGTSEGRFTEEQAREDLQIALWYSYTCINMHQYEYYYRASEWMPSSMCNASGCGTWFYRYACSLMYCGRLEKALQMAEKGTEEEPDYPWAWLLLGELRAHFGDVDGALRAVDRGLEIVPGDYEFETLRGEINDGATLEVMLRHWIDPDLDAELQAGKVDDDSEALDMSIRCVVLDDAGIGRFMDIFGPEPNDWSADDPYCSFNRDMEGHGVQIVFRMNRAGLSKMDTGFLENLRSWFDEGRWLRYPFGDPDNPSDIFLDTVVVSIDGSAALSYPNPEGGDNIVLGLDPWGHPMPPEMPEMYDEEQWEMVDAHIKKYFGDNPSVLHEITSTDIHVDIYPIPPRDGHDYYTLVTMGMGAHRMNVPEDLDDQKLERAELLINLPSWWRIDDDSLEDERWYWPIRLLKSLARLPIRLNTWLGLGHTVMQEDCEPYAEDTGMCGSIILVPATFEDDSYVCKLPDGDEVNFYQVVPLYEDEVNLKLEKGVDKLVDLIPYDCLSVVNPGRPSYAGVDASDHGHEKDDDVSDDDSENETGVFAGFVLMSRISWSKRRLIRDLKEMWGIEAEEDDDDSNDDSLVFEVDGRAVAVSLMKGPIPDGEAEANAGNNYMWPEAVDVAREHRAHLLVFVGEKDDDDLIERGKLFVKILTACCRQENASGVYTSGVVFQPEFYGAMAEMMKEDELPIFNWIWFGLYRTDDGISGYTYGMRTFGREEIEVLNAEAEPDEVRNFLANLVSYQLECDVLLKDGETIGFSENDRHTISLSGGVALPGMTLKVSYSAAEIWMDDAEYHLESIREKSLPVDEIAAYNHMAIYLRWCVEHCLMGEDFMEEHGEQVAGNDLRPFIRDVLGGRMDAGMFNSDGWGFARYYYNYCSELDSPHYPSDIDDHALRYFGPERYNSDEFKTEAYLFIPFDEEYYNDMAEVIGRRYANWKNQEIDPDTRDPSDLAKAMMEYLDCECRYFPSIRDDDPIMSAYGYARRLGVREGYVPVLVKVDYILWECLILNSDPDSDGSEGHSFDPEKVRAYRESALSAPVGDGRDVLESLVGRRRSEAEDDEMDWDEEVIGSVQGGEGRDRLASYWNYETQMTDPMILAKIPVRNPWEVFAYLPFGNWNDCPDTLELMAAAKHWFERHGAVPAAMSHDELEFILPEPVPEEDALDVAVEQYGLCPDMDQNHGTMGHLVDELRQSTVWYFWWD